MRSKRIMQSSTGSLSNIVIECESLCHSAVKSHDNSAKNYGAINNTTPTKQCDDDNIQHIQHQGQSSITSVLWNMLNQIIGTGILGIPYIYKSTGIIGSIVIMLIFGVVSVYTLNLLIYCGRKTNVYHYEGLLEKCFGIKGYLLSSICIALLNVGGMLTNLIIIADASIKVLSIWGFDSMLDRQIIILVLAAFIILPLCLFRDLSKLEKAGAVKIIAIVVIIMVIFLEFFHSLPVDNNQSNITMSTEIESIPSAVGILAFSFVCHDSSFLLFNTLSNPTNKRYFKLSFLGIFIGVLFTLCLSIPAYLTFGNNVEFNILNNYKIDNPLIVLIRIIYVFTMTLTFPGSFFLVRHIFYGWFQKLQCVYSQNYTNNFMAFTVQTAPWHHHFIFTLSIFSAVVVTSLFVTDLGVVMSVIGSIASINLAFVFPSLCYMQIMLKSQKLCVYKIMLNLIAP